MAEESHRQVTRNLCDSCREIKPVEYTDEMGREFCAQCFVDLPLSTRERMLAYLLTTIPFKVGDRVEARTAGVLLDGVGVIDEVSISPEKFGTPVYPSFRVVIEKKAYPTAPDAVWYMERQLKLVGQ